MSEPDRTSLGVDLQVVVPMMTPEQIAVVMGVLTSVQVALYDAYHQALFDEACCEGEPYEWGPFDDDDDVPF